MFKNLKLSGKMGVGFGLLIGIAVIVGANGWFGLVRMAELDELVTISGHCMEDLLNCRRQEKNFQLRGFAKIGKDTKNSVEKWQDDLEGLKKKLEMMNSLGLAASQRAIVDAIPEALAAYQKGFLEVVEARRSKDEAFAAWRKIGGDFTSTLDTVLGQLGGQSGNIEILKNFMLLRVTALYLIATGADEQWNAYQKQLEKTKTVFAQWNGSIGKSLEEKASERLALLLGEYEATGARYNAAMLTEKKADEALVKSAREVGDGLADVQKDVIRTMEAFKTRIFFLISVLLVFAIVVGVLLATGITRSVTRPIAQAVGMFEEMGKGRLHQRLTLDSNDEVGQMARAMNRFADTLEHDIVTCLRKMAAGDFTTEVKVYDEKDLIGTAMRQTSEDLNRLIGELASATDQIAGGAREVSDTSQALSQGATEQAAAIEEINSSMVELASQTKSNAKNASQANRVADEARVAAEHGNGKMWEMVAAMDEISNAGQSINKIIKVIDEIAFQTNLLALNAAVEAARAGRHGKGFAVVAEEVRNLAARSATAAKETAELIEGAVSKTENGTLIANATAESLTEIVGAVKRVTDLAGEIAAASSEQAQGISQVNQGLSQIDQVTQQNTASAEEGAAAAEQLSGQAARLKALMARFTVKESPARVELQWSETMRG
ncbi:MAG: HAMP domain-containing methyl-accepting chemotaxis protein [Thermodesulfobacteriota bacterium]